MRTSSSAHLGASAAGFSPDANRCSLQEGVLEQASGNASKPRQNQPPAIGSGVSGLQPRKPSSQQNASLLPTSKFSDQFKKSSFEPEEPTPIKKLQLHLTERTHSKRKSSSRDRHQPQKPPKDLVATILQYKKVGTKPVQTHSKQSALQLISSFDSSDDIKKRLESKQPLLPKEQRLQAVEPVAGRQSVQTSKPFDSHILSTAAPKTPQNRFVSEAPSTNGEQKMKRARSTVFPAAGTDTSVPKTSTRQPAGLSPGLGQLVEPSFSHLLAGSQRPDAEREAKTERHHSGSRGQPEAVPESAAGFERSLAHSSLLQGQPALRTSSSMFLYCQKLKFALLTQVADQTARRRKLGAQRALQQLPHRALRHAPAALERELARDLGRLPRAPAEGLRAATAWPPLDPRGELLHRHSQRQASQLQHVSLREPPPRQGATGPRERQAAVP
jgi:hypothetical protein